MKTLIQLLTVFFSVSLMGQVQTINTGERNWNYSFYETLGEFSPINIPANAYGFDGSLKWKSGNRIYLYGVDSNKTSFWAFDMDIHQWKCIETDVGDVNWGQKGVFSPTNDPGKRNYYGITWTDYLGNLYLLNGTGNSHNDLWKYDLSLGQWAWIGGYNDSSGTNGNHGEIGEESPDFFPSHRNYATAISDDNGYVYIYGGVGGAWDYYHRTDLWRYNINNNSWTLLYENPNPQDYPRAQNIVEIGVENELNHPGYLIDYTSWYSAGYLWYFSGCSQLLSPESEECYNQIWKYNLNNNLWTCVKFPDSVVEVYGEQGVSDELNTPPSLWKIKNSVVIEDDFYFFGGLDPCGYMDDNCVYGGSDEHNSLWKYNMNSNQWTWVKGNDKKNILGFYGKKGEENVNNVPSARHNSLLWAEEDNIYLFGGQSINADGFFDVWKFNLITNNFSWIDGKSYNYFHGIFNGIANHYMYDKDVASIFNYLETTSDINWGQKGEKLWRYYNVNSASEFNGIWEYNVATSENFLLKPDSTIGIGDYGELGVPNETNFPPFRLFSLLWETDEKLYLMGGMKDSVTYNDFWEFDKETNLWTWIGGAQYDQPEYNHYGEIGVPSAENYPRSRRNAATWVDELGNLWLFGGAHFHLSYYFNDLWKYNPSVGVWTLMGGGYAECNIIDYQLYDDYPSCIERHMGWRKGDDLYFLGGYGIGKNSNGYFTFGNLTDVWKYSISENIWTRVHGNRRNNNPTNYGIFQVAQITNEIGAGTYARLPYWNDEYGNFWIYKGFSGGDFSLWKFDTVLNNWIWMDGSNQVVTSEDPYLDYYNYNFIGALESDFIAYKGMNKAYLNNGGSLWEIDFSAYPNKYNKIEGEVKFDNSGNCDSQSYTISNYKFKLNQFENQYFYSNQNGYYKIFTPFLENTIFPLGFDNDYFTVNPSSAHADFSTYGNTEIIDFCLSPNGQHNDLEVFIIPLQTPRPGFDIDYKIIYKNKGNTSLSGNIEFSFQDGLFDFVSSTPNADIQNPGALIWNYSELNPFETREIFLTLNLSTTAATGDEVELTAVINPLDGDETESDNTFILTQTVVNSYDPNDKTCLEGASILEEQVGEYVQYLIRFENTGTAEAVNIVIKDEIDASKFDINTLTPIDSDYNFYTKITDNLVEFIFENINLPFEENLNTGYVLFKIKTLDTLESGDIFSNGANIFFDYNDPIITNVYTTLILDNLSTDDEVENTSIKIFPNPTDGILNIISNDSISKVELFDAKGRILSVYNDSQKTINISSYPKGIYILKIHTKKAVSSHKIIKK